MEDNKKQPNKITPPIRPSNTNVNSKFTNLANIKPMTKVTKDPEYKNDTITKQEKVIKHPTQPKNKKKIALIAVIASVVVLSLLSVFVYFSFIMPKLPVDIQIDFKTNLSLAPESGPITSAKDKMPGDDIQCSYVLSSTTENDPESHGVYVRIRAYAEFENNYYSNLFSFKFTDRQEWYEGVDGYWYYKGILYPNSEPLDAVRLIHLEDTIGSEFAGKTIKVVLSAEVIQADHRAVEEHWPTSPNEWVKTLI